jgi:hypothetical protein
MSLRDLDQGTYYSLAAAATGKLRKDATTQGITTGLGMVFYDLRPPAYLIFPVNTPLRNSIPRSGPVNAGTGVAAHWKAYLNPNATGNFAGVAEGQRNAFLSFQEKDYTAAYKELGQESFTTFTGQFAGEGFTDPMADAQTMVLNAIMLSEEGMIIGGNTSLQLGTPAAPVAALVTAATGLAASVNVSARVVAITPYGWYAQGGLAAVSAGLTPSSVRNNADSTSTTVYGGISAVSPSSNVVVTASGSLQVKFTCTPIPGAIAYAWYVDVTDASAPTTANAKLQAITNSTTYTLATTPSGSGQTAAATGLNLDNSTNPLAFDGLMTIAAQSGTWVDLGGAELTPNGDGTIKEIESILQSLWVQYQATVDDVYVSSDQLIKVSSAILAGTSGGNPSAFRINLDMAQSGKLIGGNMVVSYLSKFTMGGSKVINFKLHPGLPPGTMLFDISTNPYPQSRLTNIREILTQRDYYSLLYPIRTRRWEFGTYTHEVLAHRLPQLTAVITGAAIN